MNASAMASFSAAAAAAAAPVISVWVANAALRTSEKNIYQRTAGQIGEERYFELLLEFWRGLLQEQGGGGLP